MPSSARIFFFTEFGKSTKDKMALVVQIIFTTLFDDAHQIWIDRDYRVLYEIDASEDKLRIIGVGIKSKQLYK